MKRLLPAIIFCLSIVSCENKYATEELSSVDTVNLEKQNTVTQFKPVSPNREIVKSRFEENFLSAAKDLESDLPILSIIKKYVSDKPEAFGGSCSRYDEDCAFKCGIYGQANCVTLHQISISALPNPEYSTLTKGNKILMCEEIISQAGAVKNLLMKVNLKETDPLTDSNLQKIIDYINSYRQFDNSILENLKKVKTVADGNSSFSSLQKWQFVILPLCVSNLTDFL